MQKEQDSFPIDITIGLFRLTAPHLISRPSRHWEPT